MQMKKILIIDSLIGNDYTICLASALQKAGASITLIVPENREVENPSFAVKKWMPSKDSSKSKLGKVFVLLIYLFKLLKYIAKEKPDAIHFQFFRFNMDAILFYLLSKLKIHLIYTAHNVLPHNRYKYDVQLTGLVYRSAGKIIVHSNYIKTKLLSMFSVDEKKIVVIPHGNFDHYLPKEQLSKDEARAKLKLDSKDDVALFFGSIREYKGLDLLLDAYQKIYKNNVRIKLLIAGSPDTTEVENYYKNRINQIAANGQIRFYPDFISTEEVPVFFNAADLVVLPYKRIDHSGVVHLAYSFSKPIIATRVGDFEDAIEDGKSGYLVSPENADLLAGAIEKAFAEKENLIKMGQYAGFLNSTKYSWDEIAQKTLKIY